ncbi:hypothetical protein [Hyphomicrobium sp.]|uniref:hypothetical protein n=1 Tax=Hyphomicrobium sp. TaxID=82 RepID=UPI002FE229DB
MRSKLDQVRDAWAAGDRIAALRIASRFHDRSPETRAFQRGHQAVLHPEFFRRLGRDPEALTAAALDALARKFNLPT